MTNKKLHLIGNAHLDPVWLWQWQEGFQEVKATLRSALDRMNEFDDFVFTSSTAAMYEWIEINEPKMFKEIQARVQEGRWVLCGGWWVQSDCNLPSGESFARQALYGQRYFQEKFGVMSTVGYNVDSFGHHGMLPQLLKKSGMDYYVFMRPLKHEKHLDSNLFWWESDDGSKVLTYRIPFYMIYSEDIEQPLRTYADKEANRGWDHELVFYGVGNHGGGPTKQNIEVIHKLQAEFEDPKFAMSSPPQFFHEAEQLENIPTLHDELQMHAKGCYSVQSDVKQWNRRSENLLVTTEKFSTVAECITGQPYPDQMGRAWKNVLFNQFHDILPGSSIEVVYEQDVRDWYGEANSIAHRALNNALQSVSWNIQIDFEEGTKPIIVFNPHSWAIRANVELEFGHFGPGRGYNHFTDEDMLVDEAGNIVPIQRLPSHSTTIWRQRIGFVADLPPFGYRTYRLVKKDQHFVAAPDVQVTETVLENEFLRIEIDPNTGYISHLYDKRQQIAVFSSSAAIPVVMQDNSDTWSHGIESFLDRAGEFTARRVRKLVQGPVKSVIRVESAYRNSTITQDFILYAGLDHVEVQVTVDWHEQFRMLKLQFPVNVESGESVYEIPYGHITRPDDGKEYPGLSWVDHTGVTTDGKRYGLSILNDAKYSYHTQGSSVHLTVLRSPIYAHDENYVPRSDEDYTFMDQGVQHFRYAIFPHSEDWKAAGTVKRAAELNQRPIPVIETYHPGTFPQQATYVSVDADNVIISALKKAEENEDWVIRAYETSGQSTNARISLAFLGREITVTFGPCEIKSWRIPRDAEAAIVEVDLLERPM